MKKMNLKKCLVFWLCFILIAVVLSGCGVKSKNVKQNSQITERKQVTETGKAFETAKPIETVKLTETAINKDEESVILGNQTGLYNELKLDMIINSGNKILSANLPEGTMIYAPFDGNITVSSTNSSNGDVQLIILQHVNCKKNEEEFSVTFYVQTWSGVKKDGFVKKGECIGTIGKSVPIFDEVSALKGNNFHFSVYAVGFDDAKHTGVKDYILDFTSLSEKFKTGRLDLSSTIKIMPEEAKELVIFGDKTEMYNRIKIVRIMHGPIALAGNFPEGTKIYAPFDGRINTGGMIINEKKVDGFDLMSKKNGMISFTIIADNWSDSIKKGEIKKGDYIGTIGKAGVIFDSVSYSKGNNVYLMCSNNGFNDTKYNNSRDFIKGFLEFVEIGKSEMPYKSKK